MNNNKVAIQFKIKEFTDRNPHNPNDSPFGRKLKACRGCALYTDREHRLYQFLLDKKNATIEEIETILEYRKQQNND